MASRLSLSLTKNIRPSVLYHVPPRTAQQARSADHTHLHFGLQQKRHTNGYGGGPQLPGQVGPQPGQPEETREETTEHKGWDWGPTMHKMFESAATTTVSLFVLG